MNGFVVTNSHILFGEWSFVHDKYHLNNLQYLRFTKPLNKVHKSAVETNKVFSKAIDGLPLKGNKVVVAFDDDLLVHSSFSNQESIPTRNVSDFINWEVNQKWGKLSKYLLTFSEYESQDKSKLHSVSCPKNLINGLKSIFLKNNLRMVWAGPLSSIYLDNTHNSKKSFIYHNKSGIKYFCHDKNVFDIGSLRFIDSNPTLISDIVNVRMQLPKSSQKFLIISDLTKQDLQKLSGLKNTILKPFKDIVLDINKIDKNIPRKLLNTLSQMIPVFSYERMLNFFSSETIQNNKFWSLTIGKKIDKPKSFNREKIHQRQSDKFVANKNRSRPRVHHKKRRNINIFPFFLMTLLGLLGYFLFFNPIGKAQLNRAIEKYRFWSNKKGSTSFEQQFWQSRSILESVPKLLAEIPSEQIISIKMVDGAGSIAIASGDSINLPNFIANNYSIDPINCCGGIKQTVEFKIKSNPVSLTSLHTKYSDVLSYLHEFTDEGNLRKLDAVQDNRKLYHPVIFKVNSKKNIDNMLAYLNSSGDNVILKKIDLINTAGSDVHSATFYVAIYENN